MRLPSGATVIPWVASNPLISLTTLFVAGSMMWMLSPAKFVWMIRSCAAIAEKDTVHRTIPAKAARPRNICLFFIFVILPFDDNYPRKQVRYPPLLRLLSRHECLQGQPRRVVLRFELLAATVMGIATGLLGERMFDDGAVQAAGYRHPLDQLEVLARLLFVPIRAAGRQPHQVERRVIARMASNATRMARTLGQEDGLHLGLEKPVIQRRRCGGGRSRLTFRLTQRHRSRQGQTRRGDHVRRGPLHPVPPTYNG